MFIKPINYEIILSSNEHLNMGTYDEIEQNVAKLNLPRKRYNFNGPVIGLFSLVMGKNTEKEIYRNKLIKVIGLMLEGKFPSEEIENALKLFEISYSVIQQLFFNLEKLHQPWGEKKEKILAKYKPAFLYLEQHGAQWLHISSINSSIFKDLVSAIFGPTLLGPELSFLNLNGGLTFGECTKQAELYLSLGADVNALNSTNPDYGTFLHVYIANELSATDKLIDFLESSRQPNKPNTQYDYRIQDAGGRTPLLLAILTRQEEVALTLLRLNQKGIDVGVNIADKSGRLPLLVAAALGMKKTVHELLKQDADPLLSDNEGLTFSDYISLDENKLRKMLLPFLNVERGAKTKRSHLYYKDHITSPLCFYENKEEEKFGDAQYPHLVVLSPLPEHMTRLKKVMEYFENEPENHNNKKELLKFLSDQIVSMGSKTFLEICLEGQSDLQKFLQSPSYKKFVEKAEQKNLRHFCALGEFDKVKYLLEKGVDPNAKDNLGRTALHYAAMRFELVKKELNLGNNSRGISSEITDKEVFLCHSKHPKVVDYLFTYSKVPIDLKIRNQANNTVTDILQRESKKTRKNEIDDADVKVASECLEVMKSYSFKSEDEISDENANHMSKPKLQI